MTTLFLAAAAVGGSVLILQLLLGVLGVLDLGIDVVDDLDTDLDVGHGDAGHSHGDHFGSSLWGLVSLRTITAALTFFGLAGMAARSMNAQPSVQIVVALLAGFAGLYSVHWLMRQVGKLARDSTMQVKKAVGEIGTVYLTVPADRTGTGKVHVSVGGRLEEFAAITSAADNLPVGAKVVVTALAGADTLEVERADVPGGPTEKLAKLA